MPYAKDTEGNPYLDRWFTKGEGYYDLKLIIKDTTKNFADYEIYIENFYIVQNEEGLTIPELTSTYNGEKQIATIPSDAKYIATTNDGGTDVGEYPVILEIKYPEVFFWSGLTDKTQSTIQTTFKIVKETNNTISDLSITPWVYGSYNPEINAPSAEALYGSITYSFKDSNGENVENIATAKAGHYTVIATIEDTANYSGATKELEFEITKSKVVAPEQNSNIFIYNGTEQTYLDAENDVYSVLNNKQTNAGSYTVTISLNDKDSYEWENGTTDDLEYTWTINKAVVVVSYETKDGYLYLKLENEADEDKVEISYLDENNNKVDISELVNGKKYIITTTLKDSKNYEFVCKEGDDFIEFESEKTFTYSRSNFVKKYWWAITIVFVSIALIAVIVKLKKRKRNHE